MSRGHAAVLSRQRLDHLSGAIPFLVALVGWALLSRFGNLPEYMLPPLPQMWVRFQEGLMDGKLFWHVGGSLYRLAISFLIGNGLAIPLGIAIAMNRHVSDLLRPVLTFFQSIAGIAWVPLAVIWFGVGMGSVIFVITNTIFFGAIYSTIIGVQTIPKTLHRAVLCHGGRGIQVFTELILPGALVQIILGLRTSMAYGWRALVAGEMIAGSSGLGYLTIEAVQWYQTDTVIMGMILIGLLWLLLDRLLFIPLERRTVARWGLLQR
jgi:NitT/TauT family transport system permease protein/taurine transport system permease protein